jgi:hypothetical protein
MVRPEIAPTLLLTFLGVVYTGWSEHTNLNRGAWAYSEFMPLIPGTGIGLLPVVQWLLLPALAVWMAARLLVSLEIHELPRALHDGFADTLRCFA